MDPMTLRTSWTRLGKCFHDPNGHDKASSQAEGQMKECIYIQCLYPAHSPLVTPHNCSPTLTLFSIMGGLCVHTSELGWNPEVSDHLELELQGLGVT